MVSRVNEQTSNSVTESPKTSFIDTNTNYSNRTSKDLCV